MATTSLPVVIDSLRSAARWSSSALSDRSTLGATTRVTFGSTLGATTRVTFGSTLGTTARSNVWSRLGSNRRSRRGKPNRVLERRQFSRCQLAGLSGLKPANTEWPQRGSPEAEHGVTDHLEHPTDLTVASFDQSHADASLVFAAHPVPAQQLHLGRSGPSAIQHDSRPEPPEGLGAGHSSHDGLVDTFKRVTGVGEPGGELTVVCQKQKPLRVVVEAPDRIDILPQLGRARRHQVEHGAAAFRVAPGRHHPSWLVCQEIAAPRGLRNPSAIQPDVVSLRIRAGAQRRHDRAIDRHATRGNERL